MVLLFLTLFVFLPLAKAQIEPVSWTHLSSATGDLPVPPNNSGQSGLRVVDLDQNGQSDYIITLWSAAETVVWYRHIGDSFEKYVIDTETPNLSHGKKFKDIDGDGDIDLLFGDAFARNKIYWWENPYPDYEANTPWVRRIVRDSGENMYHDNIWGDFDGDGTDELIAWNQDGLQLLLFEIPADPKTSGPWPATPIFTWTGSTRKYRGAAAADINLDGKIDFVGGGGWFEHTGGTNFIFHPIDAAMSYSQITVGQLIPGGNPEVVCVLELVDGPLNMYEWTGSEWQTLPILGNVPRSHTLQIGDVNLDGHLDIVTGELGQWSAPSEPPDNPDAKISVLYGDGQGNFTQQIVFAGQGDLEGQLADIDNDGDLDIVAKPFRHNIPRVDIYINQVLIPLVDVPDVVGFSQSAAESAIVAAGLLVGAVNTTYSDTVPAGDVISQDPVAGTSVSEGSAVDIVVSLGTFPDLLLVQLPMDEGSGTVAGDVSGNGNNGTLINGPVFETDTPDDSPFAVRFDGADDYIDLGQLDVNGDGLTLAAWFNADSFPGSYRDPRLISKASGVADDDHVFMLGTISSGTVTRLRARVRVGGVTTTLIATSGNLSTGVWQHAALTYDGATLRLYLNGTEVGSTTLSGPVDIDPGLSVVVGAQPPGAGDRFFDGLIDDVRILQRAMSATELEEFKEDSPELLVYEWNEPVTVADRGFPWNQPPMASANGDWTVPINYAEGTLYFRVEVFSQPVPQQMRLQFCVWQDNLTLEACGPLDGVSGTPGTLETWSVEIDNMWKKNGVPIDWSRPRQRYAVAIKNTAGDPVSNFRDWNWNGEDPDEWYPLDMRFTVVVVEKGGTFSGWNNYIPTPAVVGLSQSDAESAIVAAGLLVGAVATANSDTVPAGDVISQNPVAGTSVPDGSAVDLVVSLGPLQMVDVPAVVGLSQSDAESAIVAAGLLVGQVSSAYSDTVPAGDVISQNPAAGTSVPSNSAVDIVVSSGGVPQMVDVPDVAGLSQSAAESAIVAAGLLVGQVSSANSVTVPAGDVISQNPTAGTSVPSNSAVHFTVSLGSMPTIDVWYGENQSFGQYGQPQNWINILGNVFDLDGIASLSYTLNGSSPVSLRLGADGRRLAYSGDFNVDLDIADLLSGPNTLELTATDGAGNESNETVTVNYQADAEWPSPYAIDWSALASPEEIQDVAQVVDGKWQLENGNVRTAEPGYDRLIAVGDMAWQDYEITVPITLNEVPPSGAGFGVLMRWNGHTDSPVVTSNPKSGYFPLGAIMWHRNGKLEIYGNNADILGRKDLVWSVGTKYWLKVRVETVPGVGGLYSLKAWEDGPEPATWDLTGQEDLSDPQTGSMMLIAHLADVSFGDVTINAIAPPAQYVLNVSTAGTGQVLLDPPGGTYTEGWQVRAGSLAAGVVI
jgi:beta-lactam-binding protein with PASTA domain